MAGVCSRDAPRPDAPLHQPDVPAHDAGLATWLHSIALVAAPALAMPALAAAIGAGDAKPLDPATLAAAAREYQIARGTAGEPICFADAVVTLYGGNIDR